MLNKLFLVSFWFAYLAINNFFCDCAKTQYVTCGSVLKLLNTDYRIRLHSHDVRYGTGSGQQSVTGTELQEDANSHWVIMPELNQECKRGEKIKCGDKIRLQHMATKRNLHSHHFQSPLSGSQEVSCYGEDGVGDSGDNWEVICNDDVWLRDNPVKLRHVDTKAYLSTSGRAFGRPINGQMEVIGATNPGHACEWKTAEGLFINAKDLKDSYAHTELLKILPKAIVCESDDSTFRGDITISSGCVIHPTATILAISGPIIIGENCLLEEYTTIVHDRGNENSILSTVAGGAAGKPPVLVIGSNNVFEVGCTVEALSIGERNTFECKSYVSNKVTVTNGCIIGAGCQLIDEHHLTENMVIYGSQVEQREAIDKQKSQISQLEHLRRVLPNYHHIIKPTFDPKKNRVQI